MKIFISHSWKNKTAAQLVAESLQNTAEVWLDIGQLKPGDRIQPAIDAALAQMDAVILLWSNDAAASTNVDAEIRTTGALKKPLLPVLLDATQLDRHPLLKGLYGITFDAAEPKAGLFRIQAGLVRLMLGSLDLDAASALNDLTSFEGFHAYIQDYRNKKDIGGADSGDWALRAMEQCNKTYQSVAELRDQVGETLTYIQDTFARVQAFGDDRAAIQSILNDVIRHPKSGTNEFKVLSTFIEGKIASLSVKTTPPVALRRDAPAAAKQFANEVGDAVPAANDPRLASVYDYIRRAPASLQQFIQLAASSPSTSLKQVANELHAYLANPQDLIPDDQNGLLGFLDDAWLTHNTIYRCIEAGFFGPQDIGIEWDALIQADAMVVQLLPPQMRSLLDQLLMQYLCVIAAEVAQYQPRFAHDAQANSYGAFMGGGDAAGGTSSGPQTVDDLFITGGGQVSWVGKTW